MTKPFVISFITCTIVLSCFLSPVALSFQNAQAVRFDAFGDIQVSDKIARLDNFAITLQNSPNTHGFIIVYRSRRDLPGLSSRLASEMKNYLVSSRGIEAGRIITVDGGAASCLDQELWIVPPNTAPTMREDIYLGEFYDTESAREFDDYSLGDGENSYYEGDSLEAYADAVRKQPRSIAYVIYYPRYYRERWEESDQKGTTKSIHYRIHRDSSTRTVAMRREIRERLVSGYKIPSSRVKTSNGGYRQSRSVELWILPFGQHPPVATPNSFPRTKKN